MFKIKEQEIKEQFDNKVDGENLIERIDAWEKESETFYTAFKRIVEENIAYYKAEQTDVARLRGKESKAVENRIFMAIETMIPIATSRLPDLTIWSNEENEVA